MINLYWFVPTLCGLKLCRKDFLRVLDRRDRCIQSTFKVVSNHLIWKRQLTVTFSLRPEWWNIAWPDVFLYSLSRKLHASPNVCHFQMRSCMENCAISWREIVKNTLYIQETIPYRTETRKKWILRYWFSGFSSKISMIPSSTTRRSSFTYIS